MDHEDAAVRSLSVTFTFTSLQLPVCCSSIPYSLLQVHLILNIVNSAEEKTFWERISTSWSNSKFLDDIVPLLDFIGGLYVFSGSQCSVKNEPMNLCLRRASSQGKALIHSCFPVIEMEATYFTALLTFQCTYYFQLFKGLLLGVEGHVFSVVELTAGRPLLSFLVCLI